MAEYDEGRRFQQTEFELGDFKQALSFHLQHYGGSCDLVLLDDYVVDGARARQDRPAYIKVAVDDELVKELRGEFRRRAYMLVSMPISTVVAFSEKRKGGGSRLITPGQVGMTPGQILNASGQLAKATE